MRSLFLPLSFSSLLLFYFILFYFGGFHNTAGRAFLDKGGLGPSRAHGNCAHIRVSALHQQLAQLLRGAAEDPTAPAGAATDELPILDFLD